MRTYVSILLIILLIVTINIVMYRFYEILFLDKASLMLFVNVTVLCGVVIFVAAHLMNARQIQALDRELGRTRFRVEDEQKEIQVLHAIHDISESFVHDTSMSVIFEQTLLALRRMAGADIAVLFLIDPTSKRVTEQICQGVESIEVDSPVLERIISQGASVLINRLSPRHSQFDRFTKLHSQGYQSVMMAPIGVKDRMMGILGIFTMKSVDFTGADLRLLTTFSTHVSIIMENGRLLSSAQELAVTDEMTQLYNYRYFRQRLQEEFSRAQRYAHQLSILIIDIDHFKHYNDLHGHPGGDRVLRRVGSLLKSHIRTTDFAARYGGEEFVVILLEAGKKRARGRAERLRKAVESYHFEHEEQQPGKNLTISLGVASFPDDAGAPQELINVADKALYKAKHAGRNTVRAHEE